MSAYTPGLTTDRAIAALISLAALPEVDYDFGASLVDSGGNYLSDLTPYMVKDGSAAVQRDCTALLHGSLTCSLTTALAWGKDIIAPYMIASSPAYLMGQRQKFPLGAYVATSPQVSMQINAPYTVTGYDKLYLLQSEIGDSFILATGSTYVSGLLALFKAAGVIASGGALGDAVTYPGDLPPKVTPTDLTFPLGNNTTYLDAINALLKAAGCLPLFTDPVGRYTVVTVPVPKTQAQQWTFAGTDTPFGNASGNAIVSDSQRTMKRDVYNIPNQWVFVQQGLTFAPIEGSGQYTVNNAPGQPSYQPPSDQFSIGRVLRSVQFLNASGQTDLQTQGDAIVTAALTQAEAISLSTAPWPAAWHYDVFWYTDDAMPVSNLRKVQAQKWNLSLQGDWMTWDTLVVAPQ